MSEYKIVNRVAPTPAMAQTIADVEAEKLKTEFHVPVPKAGDEMKIPFHAGETIKFVETAEASRAPFIGQAENLKGMLDFVRSMPEAELAIVSKKEFEDFKERVIRAFKEIGFDTRKFFDE